MWRGDPSNYLNILLKNEESIWKIAELVRKKLYFQEHDETDKKCRQQKKRTNTDINSRARFLSIHSLCSPVCPSLHVPLFGLS